MTELHRIARRSGIELRVSANMPQTLSSRLSVKPMGDIMAISLKPVYLTGTEATIKRTFDLVVALVGMLLSLPLFGLIALTIRLTSSGPVLFKQERITSGGRTFIMYKFRTMVRDADALKEQLRERSVVAWPDFRLVDDPRVTPLGRVLRKTSLDELPQLFNVLRGQMTLVGPRPTSFAADTYTLWQTGRLDFRPGLSGPWQVDGRDSMDFVDRCRLEIAFFARPSLRRELWLLVRTVGTVVRRTGVA
jgi:lipopolysaccharide/colanic/teichoic acid biosynthesis glycosyltransferase